MKRGCLARDDVPLLWRGHDHLRLGQLALAQLHVARQLAHRDACNNHEACFYTETDLQQEMQRFHTQILLMSIYQIDRLSLSSSLTL